MSRTTRIIEMHRMTTTGAYPELFVSHMTRGVWRISKGSEPTLTLALFNINMAVLVMPRATVATRRGARVIALDATLIR